MASKSNAEKLGSVPAAGLSRSLKNRLWFAFTFLFLANILWPLCFSGAIGKIRYLFGLAYRSHCRSFVKWTTISSPATGVNDVYHMRTSLSLPLDAETLMFNALDTNITYGHFEVSATAPVDSTQAIVEVEVFYTSPEAFNNVTMCRTHHPSELDGDTWGLSIFGSRGDTETTPLRVHIHLRLPASGPAPAQLGRLKTYLPHFSHNLHDLTAAASFEALLLSGFYGPIFSESVTSKFISVSGVNASIEGTFTATSTGAFLSTYNAPIIARINLVNDNNSEVLGLPQARLTTIKGEIRADIGLYTDISNITTADSGDSMLFRERNMRVPSEGPGPAHGVTLGLDVDTSNSTAIDPDEASTFLDYPRETTSGRPHFSVSAAAWGAPLALAITDAPLDAHLALSARTDGPPVRVTLHPTYEGEYVLETALPFVPELNWPGAYIVDPAGRGRTFVHDEAYSESPYSPERGRLKGWMGWGPVDGEDLRERGSVRIVQL